MTKNTLKIGFVVDDGLDRLDGVQKYVVTLGKYFSSQGHEVHYLAGQTSRTDIKNVHSLSRNLSIISNGGNQLSMPLPTSLKKIRELLNKEKFDVLHVQTPYSPLLAGRIIMHAPKGTAIVGTFHILPFGKLLFAGSCLLGFVQRRSIKRFDKFFSVSEPAQKFAKTAFSINSEVLPNPVILSEFRPKNKRGVENNNVISIVYLNRLVKRKGCMELLQALNIVVQQQMTDHQVTLDICSEGHERENLERYVEEHGLDKIVRFRGYITDEEKATYLQNADIAVFPSLGGESFGIVLIEGIAAGAGVVIGGDNPGYRSVLNDDNVLFDPRNTDAFATILAKYINSPQDRAVMHEKQQAKIESFGVDVIGDKLLEAYRSCKSDREQR